MIILIQAIDTNGQQRHFSWGFGKLELVFDVLNEIVSTGAQLITVELIDKGRRVQLPINVSDEDELRFITEVQLLEREWQQLLSVPINE